jgi:hypothetical protein
MLALAALLLSAATRGQAETKRAAVVFFAPAQLATDIRTTLDDALVTQLLTLPIDLHFEVRAEDGASGIDQRMGMLKQAVNEHGAVAVFWLEVRSPGHWFLYAVDAQADRVVLRALTAKSESPEALIETVALIVHATTDAVLRGEPLPEEAHLAAASAPGSPASPAMPAWPVVHTGEPSSALRLGVGYVGTTFARKLPWQSGIGLRADWLWGPGPYVGIGYTFFGSANFIDPRVSFAVDRYPFSLHAGLRFAVGDFTFSAEIGAEIELRSRRTISALAGLDPDPGRQRTIYSVCPKLESEYTILPWLRVFGGVGLDFVLANFPYALKLTETEESITIVDPHWLRLTAQLGIAIIR